MDEKRRGQAVEAAMMLFWTHGGEATTYGDIVAATGLSRKALYGVWPDKDALVHDALDLYRGEVLSALLSPLEQGDVAGLRAFWDNLQNAIKEASDWRGCFLFRSASGPLRNDNFVRSAYDAYAGEMRAAAARCVIDGQAKWELPSSLVPEIVGWQVLALNGLLSGMGARSGYTPEVDEVFNVARVSCGLDA